VNPVAAGFVAGGVLARNSGPRAALGGGLAFAAFSAAIDLFLRRETAECVPFRSLLLFLAAADGRGLAATTDCARGARILCTYTLSYVFNGIHTHLYHWALDMCSRNMIFLRAHACGGRNAVGRRSTRSRGTRHYAERVASIAASKAPPSPGCVLLVSRCEERCSHFV
jgi:hypothetical protein